MRRGRKKTTPERPRLLERVLASGCRRVAVVGLHRGAGSRTVVEALADELHGRGLPIAVTRAPRLPLDGETEPLAPIALPEGAVVATTVGPVDGEPPLETLAGVGEPASTDPVIYYRLTAGGSVSVRGPDDAASMVSVMARLEREGEGLALVDGSWDQRSFAAPGITDGMILVVGSGYSRSPERSAAALRYVVETLNVAAWEGEESVWQRAVADGVLVALGADGSELGVLPPTLPDPISSLMSLNGGGVATVALPNGLHDELLAPLVRSSLKLTLIVGDATRIHVAPVYLKAWLKKGRLKVARPARLLAVVTNPSNPTGPDAEAEEFQRIVADAIPDLPVHDVRLESGNGSRKSAWKLWG